MKIVHFLHLFTQIPIPPPLSFSLSLSPSLFLPINLFSFYLFSSYSFISISQCSSLICVCLHVYICNYVCVCVCVCVSTAEEFVWSSIFHMCWCNVLQQTMFYSIIKTEWSFLSEVIYNFIIFCFVFSLIRLQQNCIKIFHQWNNDFIKVVEAMIIFECLNKLHLFLLLQSLYVQTKDDNNTSDNRCQYLSKQTNIEIFTKLTNLRTLSIKAGLIARRIFNLLSSYGDKVMKRIKINTEIWVSSL